MPGATPVSAATAALLHSTLTASSYPHSFIPPAQLHPTHQLIQWSVLVLPCAPAQVLDDFAAASPEEREEEYEGGTPYSPFVAMLQVSRGGRDGSSGRGCMRQGARRVHGQHAALC